MQPLALRDLEVAHRAWVSPMCQYSCEPGPAPGVVTDWHLIHLGSFAVGGAPLILTEASAVSPEGRISPWDAGLWNEDQVAAWQRVVERVHGLGSRIGVQLAHAGRKASTYAPFHEASGTVPVSAGGWKALGPTEKPFGSYAVPRALQDADLRRVVRDFADSAERAVRAGFDLVEVHAAHGYLLQQFTSPVSNTRDDAWGGDLERRTRLTLEVIEAVRRVVPDAMPVLLRVSATDWDGSVEGGIEGDLERTVALSAAARERGVDLVDVSSGGNLSTAEIPVGPGYQTAFAAQVRREAKVPRGAVGMITRAHQVEHILRSGQADAVLLARAALADPRWWHRAATELGESLPWPGPYARVPDHQLY